MGQWRTYAAVAANISTLRALVKTPKTPQKITMYTATIAKRIGILSTKYRVIVAAIGIIEDSRVPTISEKPLSFWSLYSVNPASSSLERLRMI